MYAFNWALTAFQSESYIGPDMLVLPKGQDLVLNQVPTSTIAHSYGRAFIVLLYK